MGDDMIDGKEVVMGEQTFICPPAPFGIVRKYEAVFAGKREPTLSEMGDILFAALRRNYPDLEQEVFEQDNLDLGNFKAAFLACLKASGAEEPAPGEASPGTP